MLSPPDSPLGKQLRNYVCVRIIRMDNVDIGLFEHDRNNTIYFYILNADEQIYMRYGGRDSRSADSYLNLDSLALAATKGLELHKQYQEGKLAKAPRPKPMSPRDFPMLVKRTYASNNCVECHLIGDFQNLHREEDGTLDKLVHLFRSPDIRTLGIQLDVPKGLVVKETEGAAAAAGMKPGDRIAKVGDTIVWTFADLQHFYDKTPRTAKSVQMTVDRGGQAIDLKIALPERWWYTDTRWRQSSVEPRYYFDDRPLTAEERQKYGVKPGSFASYVKYVSGLAASIQAHELQAGDVILAIDGKDTDEHANTASLYLTLRKTPGDAAELLVLRDGKKIQMTAKSIRMSFRK